jgi:hypothetical protein
MSEVSTPIKRRRAPRRQPTEALVALPTASGVYAVPDLPSPRTKPAFAELTPGRQRRNGAIARDIATDQAAGALERSNREAFTHWCSEVARAESALGGLRA